MDYREKTKLKISIYKMSEKEKQMNKEKSLINKVAIVASVVLIFSGMSYATTKIIEKIWKEPEVITGYYKEDGSKNENPIEKTHEVNLLSNEEVENFAIQKLKKFGKGDNNILNVRLEDRPQNTNLKYIVEAENRISISVDATNKNTWGYSNNLENISEYRGNKEELEKVVRNIIKEHDIDLEDYKLVKVNTNTSNEETAYIWYYYFYKDYGTFINKYEEVAVAIVPEINEVFWFIVNQDKFENNEILITEEDAKNIALEAEKKIDTGYEIEDVDVKIDIAKMNSRAHFRLNNYEIYKAQTNGEVSIEDLVYYRTEDIVRRCYMVTIIYNIPKHNLDSIFTYFIDATTGEIIGGNEHYYTSGITE